MKIHPLKKERLKRGLTRFQAAKILDVHTMSIYFWETWTKTPRLENIRKINKEFGIDPVELLNL